jgi:hypothetical protein
LAEKQDNTWWWGLVIPGLAFAFLIYKFGFQQTWDATTHGVSPDHFYSDKKPIDCDYDTAPIGNKGCHYEEQKQTYNQGAAKSVYVHWLRVED